MISGRRHQEEMAHLQADREWWMARLPAGWKLYGFVGQHRATAWTDKGSLVENISGRLVQAFYEQKERRP
jgi:hypothetical protein